MDLTKETLSKNQELEKSSVSSRNNDDIILENDSKGIVSSPSRKSKNNASLMRTNSENKFILFLENGYAAFKVFGMYLITIESVFGCTLTVGATILTYFLTKEKVEQTFTTWDGHMDWVLLSFVVVTPMSASITMAFQRRERALQSIANFRSNAYQIYLAHACWDWSLGKGREKSNDNLDYLEHSDLVLSHLITMAREICEFLTLPTTTRARHRVTKSGKQKAKANMEIGNSLYISLYTVQMTKISNLTEVMKSNGLPPNEASRIRQWERIMGQAIEDLRMLKMYRTPQALRSFARIFTVFLPPFYAPYYAQLSHDIGSLAIGVIFALLISLSLTALFETIYVLEDPFVGHLTLDGIDVHEELFALNKEQLQSARKVIYPGADEFALPSSASS